MRVRWSQNFLVDRNVVRKCVAALDLEPHEPVLEIGPGRGALTEHLAGDAKKLVAVEIDPALAEKLAERFKFEDRFHLIHQDFLDLDLESHSELQDGNFKVIGNLPYAVVSPIVQKILRWKKWTRAVFMVQKEVGDRMRARPGTKDYGILSVSVQAQCRIEKVCTVSPHCFRPVPQVDSVVLRLFPLERAVFDPQSEAAFFDTVRGAFAHRRKTILNSLGMALDLPADRIRGALERSGLDAGARAETVSIPDFKRLSEMLYNLKNG